MKDFLTPRPTASRSPAPVLAGELDEATPSNAFLQEQLGLGAAAAPEIASAVAPAPRPRRDLDREGTLTDPRDRSKAVPLDRALSEARSSGGDFGSYLMSRYAFGPRLPSGDRGDTIRFFSNGLNTPEPEASRRTRYMAETLGLPMMHLHNGTNKDGTLPAADQIDNITALVTRSGLKRTPLMDSMERLLSEALGGADPKDVHAILHSDATIGGTRVIHEFRQKEIARRLAERGQRGGAAREAVEREVDRLLEKHLFVELHGNAAADLPQGPRYLVWTDREDPVSHNKLPLIGELGKSGTNPDRDNDRAVYVDYDGPYGGWDSHNMTAGGAHVVRATLEANGVESSQELWERAHGGARVTVPSNVKGDPRELWNPHNAKPPPKKGS